MGILKPVVITLVVLIALYFAIAFGLALLSPLPHGNADAAGDMFTAIRQHPHGALPALEHYQARDGTRLDYRRYPAGPPGASAQTVLVLLHGSGYQSAYLQPLATALAEAGVAVYTPDLRGHGVTPKRRGDVDYIGQLQDDLDDFLALVHRRHPDARLILGGHSSGGGLVIRYAGGAHQQAVDGYLLLAPYVHYDAPTIRHTDGGWAEPDVPRIIGLLMLNKVGITRLNHLPVVRFNMPADVRDGTETLHYSYRLQVAMHPGPDYGRDIAAMDKPTLVVVGRDDQVFKAAAFPDLFARYNDRAEVALLGGLGHLDLVDSPLTAKTVEGWLGENAGSRH